MSIRDAHGLPSMNALLAFDSAARHASFTLAARELRTSQAAISRQVAALEECLSVRLFDRTPGGVVLNETGVRFRDAVAAGVATIQRGVAEVAVIDRVGQVVIACSHEVSHHLVMPRFAALQQALGRGVRIRLVTYHYSAQDLPPDPLADLRLTWEADDVPSNDRVVVYEEAVRAVCSPAYTEAHPAVAGSPAEWADLTLLDLQRPNEGWATWDDWFAVVGRPRKSLPRLGYDCYTYVLTAAAAGHGVALGWRQFLEREIEAGELVGLGPAFVEYPRAYHAVLTEKGRGKPLARTALDFFGGLSLPGG